MQVIRKESQEQTIFFIQAQNYLKAHKINTDLIFAIPNGGSRHILEAVSLKRQGVKSGIPDIFFAYPSKHFHGLFIEMKRKKTGKTSKTQEKYICLLRENNYCCEVCAGADAALECLKTYLRG